MRIRIESILVAALVAEFAIFGVVAPNFLTVTNLLEVVRFSVELGLLATALTPVIIAGGIDLSVGSMMGLAAVVFGALFENGHFSPAAAAALAIITGLSGGALNALFIAGLDIPPLIVTLGSYSLFRGIAEGMTGGAVNYTGFPANFLFFGKVIWPALSRYKSPCLFWCSLSM